MLHLIFSRAVVLVALVCSITTADAGSLLKRQIPQPLPHHPGNVFLEGETARIKVSDGVWRLINYEDRVLFQTTATNGEVNLGKLPVGFYRLFKMGDTNWVSLAVLKPLRAPTPINSPICLDVAMSWFYGEEKMADVASLCALAGVNWTRDRLSWAEVEPEKGKIINQKTRYDSSAYYQTRAGLQVLQVNHISPRWATRFVRRFPPDLRDAYRFYYEMAKRWRDTVRAFEPWNEADIPNFGGHTGAEMASFQKASYLALKKGNPNLIVCMNVFALHNRAQLEDVKDNQTAPYFDTYNFHHYEPFDNYPTLYADHRSVSAGKPLWVTEAALPVKWSGSPELKELSEEDLKIQSERVVKTFACSLNEGSAATFYFLFPHYVEGKVQFGLVRPDLTPRAGYVALAACGRLLADAKPLGRWLVESQKDLRAFLFEAKPDGVRRNVLVLWSAGSEFNLQLPAKPIEIYDHLGRLLYSNGEQKREDAGFSLKVTGAPLFVLFETGTQSQFSLKPPANQVFEEVEKRCPAVVLQSYWSVDKIDLKNSAYKVPADKQFQLPLFVYNFGEKPVKGVLTIEAPEGWVAVLREEVQLAPMERKEISLTTLARFVDKKVAATIKVRGDFGAGGKPVLSVRLISE